MRFHNNITDTTIREENETYNKIWIKKNSLNFFDSVSLNEFKTKSPSRTDSSPMMVVWLKNIDRLIDLKPKSYNLKNFSLIDIGCGTGISTLYLREKYIFKSYLGIDFEKSFIKKARFNSKRMSFDDVHYIESDAAKLFLDNTQNFLFLFNPFGLRTMGKFLDNNLRNLKENNSIIGYVNDLHIDYFENFDAKIIRNNYYNISLILF